MAVMHFRIAGTSKTLCGNPRAHVATDNASEVECAKCATRLAKRSARVTRAAYKATCERLGVDAAAFEALALSEWTEGRLERPDGADYWQWLEAALTAR